MTYIQYGGFISWSHVTEKLFMMKKGDLIKGLLYRKKRQVSFLSKIGLINNERNDLFLK